MVLVLYPNRNAKVCLPDFLRAWPSIPNHSFPGLRDLEQGVEFGVEAQVEDAVERQIEQGGIGHFGSTGEGYGDDGSLGSVGHHQASELGGYFGTDDDSFGTATSLEAPPRSYGSQSFFSEPSYLNSDGDERETYSDSLSKTIWSDLDTLGKVNPAWFGWENSANFE